MGVVAIFAAIAVMVYNHVNVKPNNSILAKKIEALSQSEDNTAGACCLNGYKKWYGTTNVPTNRKEYFRDCWCNPQEGYDPQRCVCD